MKDLDDNHINDFWDVAYGGVFSSRHSDGSKKPSYSVGNKKENNLVPILVIVAIVVMAFLLAITSILICTQKP